MADVEKSGTEEGGEQAEVEATEEVEASGADGEQEPEAKEEAIPKRRFDELLARNRKTEEDLAKAINYINGYIVNKQRPQQAASVEQKLDELSQQYKQLENQFNYRLLKEQKEAELVAEVETELDKRPHLREWATEIYQAIAFDTERSAADVAKALDARLKKVGGGAVQQAVTTKKAVAGHKTASAVAGKAVAQPNGAQKSKVAGAKTWDELEEAIADSAISVRDARAGV